MEAIDSLLFAIFALYSWASLHFTDVLYIILQTKKDTESAGKKWEKVFGKKKRVS